jgi:hypothetical protein
VALKLTSATQRTFQHGLKLSILPKTFQDAVQICSRLQIPYLWIDALCMWTLVLRSNTSDRSQVSYKMMTMTGTMLSLLWPIYMKMLT